MGRRLLIVTTMERSYARLRARVEGLTDDAFHGGVIGYLRDLYFWNHT